MSNLSILIIDEDEVSSEEIEKTLAQYNMTVDIASNVFEANSKIGKRGMSYDAVICDLNLSAINGRDFSKRYYDRFPIILMTDIQLDSSKEKIIDICDACIEKVESGDRIYSAVLKAIERKSLRLDRRKIA